jgi:hypothetical protein
MKESAGAPGLQRLGTAVCLLGMIVGVACGGGGGGDDPTEEPEDRETNPLALLQALVGDAPSPLPRGVTVGDRFPLRSSLGGGDEVAYLGMSLVNEKLQFSAEYIVFRTEKLASDYVRAEDSGESMAVAGLRGARCEWYEFGVILDLESVSYCSVAVGKVAVFLETGPVATDEALNKDGVALLKDLAEWIQREAKGAAQRSVRLQPETQRYVQSVYPPPPPPDGMPFNLVEAAADDKGRSAGALNQVKWTNGGVFIAWVDLFPTSAAAEAYAELNVRGLTRIEDVASPRGARCFAYKVDTFDYRGCSVVSNESHIQVVRKDSRASAAVVDKELQGLLEDAAERLSSLRSGKLPKLDPRPKTTPTPTPPKGTPTPTATPTAPPLTQIETGTWRFTVTVRSTCPNTTRRVGDTFEMVFQLTDSNSDGVIKAGETFRLQQTQPVTNDNSGRLTLPTFETSYSVKSGSLNGSAYINITFTSPTRGSIHLVEDYNTCKFDVDSLK